MTDMEPDIDWTLTTWEGLRREQLRRYLTLSLRDRLLALEEMAEISRRLEDMRRKRAHDRKE